MGKNTIQEFIGKGYLEHSTNGEAYGALGMPSGMTDSEGTPLFVGDVVECREHYATPKHFVVYTGDTGPEKPHFGIMGFHTSSKGRTSGVISTFTYLIKVKSFDEVGEDTILDKLHPVFYN